MRQLVLLLMMGLLSAGAIGATVEEASAELAAEVVAGRKALVARQAEIQAARAALLAELRASEAAVRELEVKEATFNETVKQRADKEALAAKELKLLSGVWERTVADLSGGLGQLDSQLSEPELADRLEVLRVAQTTVDEFSVSSKVLINRTEPYSPTLSEVLDVVAEISARQERGLVVDGGTMSGADGGVLEGRIAVVGPLMFGVSGGQAGLVVMEAGSALPRLVPVEGQDGAQVRRLLDAGEAVVPVDVTGGEALRAEAGNGTLVDHLRQGGATMIPLLLLAAVCVVLSIYKLVSLARLDSSGNAAQIAEILMALQRGNPNEAFGIARGMARPLGPVICEGIEHRDAPKEHIEEIMYERILAQVPALERLLSPLAVCASVAPLLGLLGTVTGMIHTFRLITVFGTGDAKVLSGGISEALVTTEVGLMIAIPALLVHAYLSRRVRKAVAATQQSAIMFVNGLKLRLEE